MENDPQPGPTGRPFDTERSRLVELCLRMDGRAGLLSQAAYWPQRMSAADRAEAEAAARQNQQDEASVHRILRWALEHHPEALCAWAEAAAALPLSAEYVSGWTALLEAWRRGEVEPESPAFGLPWLVAMWARGREASG